MELKNAPFPKMLSELNYSNSFFKRVCLILLALLVLEFILIVNLAIKDPIILAFDVKGLVIDAKKEKPETSLLVNQAINHYVDIRYVWDTKNVNEKFAAAEAFILDESLLNFREAVGKVITLAKEKGVTQKVYVEKIEVNLKKSEAVVFGERITSVEKLRAVNAVKIKLTFEHDQMTKENPWGIYIVKEEEELR